MTVPAAQTLRRTPLFATLTEDDLRRVAAVAVPRKYARKETVFREGDRADGFFVVESGKVKVFKLSEEGKEQVLHVLEPGQSFAEAAIFEGGSYPAHAEALADSELLLLPKPAFIDLLERNPRLAVRMLASLSRWLRRMTDLPVSKNVLASRLGTVPETFSRTLKKLQGDGLIAVRGKQIRILSAGPLFSLLSR